MHKYLRRSSNGTSGRFAQSNTRSLNVRMLWSRFRNLTGSVSVDDEADESDEADRRGELAISSEGPFPENRDDNQFYGKEVVALSVVTTPALLADAAAELAAPTAPAADLTTSLTVFKASVF